MSARSTTVNFNNLTSHTLTLTNAKLEHGVWSQNLYPPQTIGPNEKGTWMSESDGFMTGTEGTVTYAISGGGSIVVSWDNPYVGSNSYGDSASSGYKVSRNGGDGNNATVTFTLETSDNLKSVAFQEVAENSNWQ